MPAPPKRLYWDACSWIALIQDETVSDADTGVMEHRGSMCRAVVAAAKKNIVELATSAFSLAEVCKRPPPGTPADAATLAAFFENSWVLNVSVDTYVGGLARDLLLDGHPGLKPADAVHLASALAARVEAFHTFDRRLLKLSGKIVALDGSPLLICKPEVPAPPAPLLEELKRDAGASLPGMRH
ncbi:type II toxin-antitoxin system VapC family toxin [Roseomonas sp. BN140053]|uniref:type II toxin-antitoxin system VapC family toxin n=1 Tax=Roseomonas sp. BN140053 TaxID=3391898 RepID=UPI0039E90E0E